MLFYWQSPVPVLPFSHSQIGPTIKVKNFLAAIPSLIFWQTNFKLLLWQVNELAKSPNISTLPDTCRRFFAVCCLQKKRKKTKRSFPWELHVLCSEWPSILKVYFFWQDNKVARGRKDTLARTGDWDWGRGMIVKDSGSQ